MRRNQSKRVREAGKERVKRARRRRIGRAGIRRIRKALSLISRQYAPPALNDSTSPARPRAYVNAKRRRNERENGRRRRREWKKIPSCFERKAIRL